VTPLLYQSVIRVPLLIFEPGRTSRLDIRDNTSTIDVLPTLLHLFKERPATWSEGRVLPPFGGSAVESARSIYAVFAKGNKSGRALERASTMLVQGPHKLTHFFGYQQLAGKERTELYDLVEDPEELTNLYDTRSLLASKMLMEIKDRLSDVNRARSSS
jgi:arylsulfatase A-like enzyme